MLTRLHHTAALLTLASASCFAQGTINHIVVIVKENRSFDSMFGSCAASAGGPIANLTGFSSSSPQGNCKVTSSTTCSSSPISLVHLNPSQPDGYNSDLPHSRQSIVDSIDGGNMDGFGGICSNTSNGIQQCWWNAPCPSGGGNTCTLAGSQGAAGTYSYFNCTDLPFYDQMIAKYGIADHYFPYGTPSYPDHLAMIASVSNEAVDNPYTPSYLINPGQWTCDAVNVGGTAPSGCTSGSSPGCSSGGYEYASQVLSMNPSTTASECVLGTSVAAGHYYVGGNNSGGGACVCDEGATLTVQNGTPYTQLPHATCTVPSGGCTGTSGTCTVATEPGTTPSWGGNKGSLCVGGSGPTFTTVLDLLDAASVSWRVYAPVASEDGYYWNMAAYVAHIRYGSDWTNNVFSWAQFDKDVAAGTLPQISWLVAPLAVSDHPFPGSNILDGMNWTAARLQKLFQSSLYESTTVFMVWDDPGGFYDHVAVPTTTDSAGYAPRAPLICVGPYCKNSVSSTQYEPASIVRCIEDVFSLPHTLGKDATATSVCPSNNSGMVNLAQAPIPPPVFFPKKTLFAESRAPKRDTSTDVVTVARLLWWKLHRYRKEPEELAAAPHLSNEHCFEGTHLHRANYLTATGLFSVEVCGSDDGKQLNWPGQNPMDPDDADEPKKH